MVPLPSVAPIEGTGVVGRGRPQEMDRYVGSRIRQRRIMLGMTQQQLAELVGVTYQQAHKYERGTNRVSAGRLHQIALALGVGINYFYEHAQPDNGSQTGEQQLMPKQRILLNWRAVSPRLGIASTEKPFAIWFGS